MRLSLLSGLLVAALQPAAVAAQASGTILDGPFPADLHGSNFTYPWPPRVFRFSSQLQELDMAFLDVPPCGAPNGKTAVLLHGKNFCAPTWNGTIRALSARGYRVVAPDQVGFCKSSKPAAYQFSLHQLAMNTRALLQALGVETFTLIGHSVGAMLSTRFALLYPEAVEELVLMCPVGLEDYIQKGVPYISIEASRATEAASTYASIRGYQQAVYYVNEWRPAYDVWVNMLVNIYYGSAREAFTKNQAQVVDMVLTGPVAPYFKDLKPRTLLVVGEKDRTAIGAAWAPPQVAATLGHFDVLGPQVASQLANGTLISYPDLGHTPQISHPDIFHSDLLGWLSA
ncbi:alpha/beta hydrolase fold domain-containing protein [Stachybotrys elegans]|uniref:Alpha/beta hydrolase fold domain-containing protein n=1 Tax=Stachybotrys elegans TaxID=80388 RepID=A0A8K0T227_9HYPO|nr:alpha/beta hydrolase fold domain-containing protein [Stachybotrys elegans]